MRRVGPNSFTEIYFAGCNPGFVETSDGYVMIDSPQQPIDARALARAVGGKGADPLPDQYRAARRSHRRQRLFPESAGGRAGQVAGMLRPVPERVRLDRGKARALQADRPGQRLAGRPSGLSAVARAERDLYRRADAQCRQSHLQHHPHARPHRAADLGLCARGRDRVYRRQRLSQMPDLDAGMRSVGMARGA